MRVLHVCSEFFPLLKTGGLADVAAALPVALDRLGCSNRILVPGFPAFMAGIENKQLLVELAPKFGAAAIRIYLGLVPGGASQIYVIDAPELYARPGNPYADANNQAYADNYQRFALLGYVAAELAAGLDVSWQAQLIHAHDWHAGLAPAYLKAAEISSGCKLAASVFTVHNLAYQGVFPPQIFSELGLPSQLYGLDGLEFYGQVSFLKAGLAFADKITTVSPSYAREIQGIEQGCGLNGLLAARNQDLNGILNGVDPLVWSPATDSLISHNYSQRNINEKLNCKTTLQQHCGLTVQNEKPLFCVVSRLTEQKGMHLVVAGVDEILKFGGQIVILGSGDAELESALKAAAAANPAAVAVAIGYDEAHAHRVIAGSDVILVPSRFEPCGLTQLYGLAYGTLPLVRKVGGLADTVSDCSLENLADGSASGFVFEQFNVDEYCRALRRAFTLFKRKAEWKRVQKRGMQQDFAWDKAARQYLALYQQLVTAA